MAVGYVANGMGQHNPTATATRDPTANHTHRPVVRARHDPTDTVENSVRVECVTCEATLAVFDVHADLGRLVATTPEVLEA